MPKPPLHGRVLVTGASSGIGRELARQLAPDASALILVARRRDRLDELASELARPGLELLVVPADLTDPDEVRRVLAEAGPVDVLVNNAGSGDLGLFERLPEAKLLQMLDLNVRALTQLTRGVVPGMVARRSGGILNISSGFGLHWSPGAAAYAGSKHYVTCFSDVLRVELASVGVVVTQALPGPVRTEFLAIAGNPTDHDVPSFVEIDAATCARQVLAGFRAGRARVVPGALIRFALAFDPFVPRWLLRWVYRPVAGYLRRRAEA